MDAKLRKTFYRTAYILMIIFTVFSAFCFLVPLAWMIPMTLRTKKAYEQAGTADETRHTALGIWQLFVSGVLPGFFTLLAANAYKVEELGIENHLRGMFYRTAYQLMIIATVFGAFWFLFPMAWLIPMTLRAKKAYKQAGSADETRHTALAVWSFFFVNIFAALFLLLAANNFKAEELASAQGVGSKSGSFTVKAKAKKPGWKRYIPMALTAALAVLVTIFVFVGVYVTIKTKAQVGFYYTGNTGAMSGSVMNGDGLLNGSDWYLPWIGNANTQNPASVISRKFRYISLADASSGWRAVAALSLVFSWISFAFSLTSVFMINKKGDSAISLVKIISIFLAIVFSMVAFIWIAADASSIVGHSGTNIWVNGQLIDPSNGTILRDKVMPNIAGPDWDGQVSPSVARDGIDVRASISNRTVACSTDGSDIAYLIISLLLGGSALGTAIWSDMDSLKKLKRA